MMIDYEEIMDELEAELWTFQWAYPDMGNNRGEVFVDRDDKTLNLEVWVPDNDDPEDDTPKRLLVTVDITTQEAKNQIRGIIHAYLCHEADEQMYFNGERTFYPHEVPA